MDEEPFTYATLRKIERQENTSPRLTRLEGGFWEKLGEHLTRLRQAFQDQQEEDPTSRRTVVLADELRNTQRLAESIWGLREKKVVQASLAATRKREGASTAPEHTTPEERRLYTQVCGLLQAARDETAITDPFSRRRLDASVQSPAPGSSASAAESAPGTQAEPRAVAPPGGSPPPMAVAEPAGVQARQETAGSKGPHGKAPDGEHAAGPRPGGEGGGPSGAGTPGEEAPAQAPAQPGRGGVGAAGEHQVELRLVQALNDVPRFAGPDLANYELAKGEIGNLPARAAELLEQRGLVRVLPGA